MGNSTLISGAHTTLRLSGFPTLICVPLSLTVYNLVFSATSQKVTAEFRNAEDYSSFAEQVRCSDEDDPALGWTPTGRYPGLVVPPSATGFRRVQRDGRWIYQSVVTLVGKITDDQVYDPDETFRMALQRGPNLPNYVERINTAIPGVSSSSSSSHLVTILDDARPPANLEATVAGVRVVLTWDELPGDRAVETYEVKVNDGPWRALDTGPRTHTGIGGLTPGVENTITVGARYWGPERPRWGRGDCDVFNCSVTVMGPMLDTAHADGPGAVTGLAVVSRMTLGEAKLSWTPPSDTGASGISGYQWRATGGSFDVEPEFLNQWHDIATSVIETDGNTTSAIINWLEGVDHTIYVRAWGGAVASVTLTGTGANQPTNLRATAVADTWVTLSWTAPSVRPETIDLYHVETRDPFTDNRWSYGGEGTGGNGTTYTVEGLEPGVPYIFRVRGRSESLGLFTPSDYFARGTLSAGSPALALAHVAYPPGATSLFASANGGSRIDLGWITTNPASTSYDLEWSADGATWQAVDPDDDGADTTYGHTGLTAGTTYYYRVRGVNGDGPGPWALAAATTSALAPREAQAANNPATGAPSISGTAQVGETLTADTSDIADADGLAKAAFSYQWQAGGADISGATDSTYTLVDDDAGKAVSVAVSFTDDAGSAESVTSAATAAVEAPPLTASFENAPSSHDGSSNFTFELRFSEELRVGYRTLRDHAFTVDGGTVRNASRLEPGSNRGWRIEVRPNVNDDVTVVLPVTTDCNDDGAICTEDGRKLSSRVELTVNGPEQQAVNSPATGAPTISGTAQVGGTLTADTSGVADADGLTNAAFSYQWQADGADISGATASTYTLTDADKGAAISVTVSFTDDAGNEESLTSAATAAVEAAADPHAPQEAQGAAGGDAAGPTDRPHGLTAEASGGAVVLTWKAPEGYRSDYRILRNRPELGEAEPLVYVAYTDTTDVTYTDTDVEPGVLYVYSVTALDFLGDAGEASRPVEIRMQATSQQQTANSPATGAPTITGTAQVGGTLTADTSAIADADGLDNVSFSYQWLVDGAEIQDATDATYTPVVDDMGKAISVTVSFTDDAGNEESLTSAATAVVEALEPDLAFVVILALAGAWGTYPGDTITLSAGVRNDGNGASPETTLRYYQSTDETIEASDTEVGTEAVAELAASASFDGGVEVTAPSSPGTYYYGACVDAVAGEPDTTNNCSSSGVRIEVLARNSAPTGLPTISGTARVGETLTVDTSGVADEDGLTKATFNYQWVVNEESDDSTGASYTVVVADDGSATWVPNDGTADTDIEGATGPTYTLTEADEGRPIRVRVSFTDDSGNSETLISAPTLMAGIHAAPTSHDGESAFTFELRFSEEFGISYKTLRDHAFTVTGGAVRKAQRLEQGSNVGWRITVSPDSSGAVTIILPITEDCDAQGAICTEDGRKLSTELELTVSGP